MLITPPYLKSIGVLKEKTATHFQVADLILLTKREE
jgi:hypothetical protein